MKIQIDIELDPRAIELIKFIERNKGYISLFDLENIYTHFYSVFTEHENVLFYKDYLELNDRAPEVDIGLTPVAKQAIVKYRELKRHHENNN